VWVQHLGNQRSRRLDVGGPAEEAPDPSINYPPSVNLEDSYHYTQKAMAIAEEMLK
jgi:hypothetical protein